MTSCQLIFCLPVELDNQSVGFVYVRNPNARVLARTAAHCNLLSMSVPPRPLAEALCWALFTPGGGGRDYTDAAELRLPTCRFV